MNEDLDVSVVINNKAEGIGMVLPCGSLSLTHIHTGVGFTEFMCDKY